MISTYHCPQLYYIWTSNSKSQPIKVALPPLSSGMLLIILHSWLSVSVFLGHFYIFSLYLSLLHVATVKGNGACPQEAYCYQTQARCLCQAGRLIDYHCIPWNTDFCSERISFPSPLLSISPRTHLILWCLNALIWELVFPTCFGSVSSVPNQAKSSKVQMSRERLGFGS